MSTQTEATTTVSGWAPTGDLPWPRQWDSSGEGPVLLPDGRVLAAGGGNNRGSATFADAALYDPATGQWTVTGSLATSRRLHTLTVLPNGKVLAAGGVHGAPGPTPITSDSAELYDPATGTWTATGSLRQRRSNHCAVLLPDGRVFVAGGASDEPPLDDAVISSAEIYDPATGVWTAVRPMIRARATFPAIVQADGTVLVIGGTIETGGDLCGLKYCEIYNPANDSWTPTDPFGTPVRLENGAPRVNAEAVALSDGSVLLAGGHSGGPLNWSYSPFSLSAAEKYDPVAKKWSVVASMGVARDEFRLIRLNSGKVIAIGGLEYGGYDVGYQNSEIFDPATGQWGPLIGLSVGRTKFGAVKLADGRVLIAGGATILGAASPNGNHVLITSTDLFTE